MIAIIREQGYDMPLFKNDDLTLRNIQPLTGLFNKLQLPLPDINETQKTFENGFNLFINYYGVVLRLYERHRDKSAPNTYCEYGHVFHQRSAPPIGIIRMPQFNLQIMPGLLPYNTKIHQNAENVGKDFAATLGTPHDTGARNLGFLSPKHTTDKDLMLLDTVFPIFNHSRQYVENLGKNSDTIIERAAYLSDLQESFYKAWVTDRELPMQIFWSKCRLATLKGERLSAGWLVDHDDNPVLQMTNRGKGNFIEKSVLYDRRLKAHLKRV